MSLYPQKLDRKRVRSREYRRERAAEYSAYFATPEYRERNRRNKKLRRLADPQYAIREGLRQRIWISLRAIADGKNTKCIKIAGCDLTTFKAHVESLFKPEMKWENYGEWQIDHIIPCIRFDLRDKWQAQVCFHYTNLQPLWKKENQTKYTK